MTKLITIDLDSSEVLEALADVQHEIWAHWMKYQFSCCHDEYDLVLLPQGDPTGGRTIPAEKVERWQHQLSTAYTDLTERERDSDREQALKILKVLEQRGAAVFCIPALPINPDDDALIDKLVERVSAKLQTRSLTRRADTASPYDAGAPRPRPKKP